MNNKAKHIVDELNQYPALRLVDANEATFRLEQANLELLESLNRVNNYIPIKNVKIELISLVTTLFIQA